jgi:hypothetical protein
MKQKSLSENTLNKAERILLGCETIDNTKRDFDKEFFIDFSKEIIFDSLLMESGKNGPLVKGVENDEKWFELIEDATKEHCNGASLSDQHPWDEMIANAVENRLLPEKKIVKFPFFTKHLIAAVIILSIVSIVLVMKEINGQRWSRPDNTAQLITDTLNESNIHKKLIAGNGEKSKKSRIMALDSGTIATIDSGAQIADIQIGNQKVSLSIVKGAVAFTVSKKRSRNFIVRAGIADIVVTGTQFRVVRMDDVLSVAVIEGSVNAIYLSGSKITTLRTGQAALIFKDTITVVTNDSLPDIPERTLLNNIISVDENELKENRTTSKVVADSLLNNLFTPGMQYLNNIDLIEDFGRILESKGRYRDALYILKHHSGSKNDSGYALKLLKMKSELLLKVGDTSEAVHCLEEFQSNDSKSTENCTVLLKLYKINLKRRHLLDADSCLIRYISCNPGKRGIDKVIIDHAHLLRNESMFDAALYWYEYILEMFSESKYRSDAEYWITDCIVQRNINKKSAIKKTGPSGW